MTNGLPVPIAVPPHAPVNQRRLVPEPPTAVSVRFPPSLAQ